MRGPAYVQLWEVPNDIPPRRDRTASSQWMQKLLKRPSERPSEGRAGRDGSRYCCQLINPNESSWLFTWDVFIVFSLLYIALVGSFEVAFLEPNFDLFFLINCALDVVFGADMVLQFCVAQPDPTAENMLVMDPAVVAREYLSFWFWIDFLSVLPVDIICALLGARRARANLTRFGRLLRILRLLRLNKVHRVITRWHASVGVRYALISLLWLLSVIFLVSHWMSCLWGGIAWHCAKDPFNQQPSWLAALREEKGGGDGLYDSPLDVYFISLYWAIVTITGIGYGDITPQSGVEYAVASLGGLAMAFVWAYVIGGICGIVATMQPHEISFRQTMDDLNDLMDNCLMPHSMRKDLRSYFHHSRSLNRLRIEKAVIDKMSPSLQGAVALFQFQKYIELVPYLRGLDREIHIEASRSLRMMVYPPCELIAAARTLFIVRQGICVRKGKVLSSGAIWGEDHLLYNGHLHDKTAARALSYVNVLMLHASDVFRLCDKYPSATRAVRWRKNVVAITRGLHKLAAVVQVIGLSNWMNAYGQMTKNQTKTFLEDVMMDRFSASNFTSYTQNVSRQGLKEYLTEQDTRYVLATLSSEVAQLGKQMRDMAQTQAELLSYVHARP